MLLVRMSRLFPYIFDTPRDKFSLSLTEAHLRQEGTIPIEFRKKWERKKHRNYGINAGSFQNISLIISVHTHVVSSSSSNHTRAK